jgi:outer membrane protein assembly factor BamB
MFSSPAVSNGMVYVGSNFSVDCKTPGRLYAFEASTGALVWSFTANGSIGDGSPAVIGGTVVIGAGDAVYGLDALTGSVQWQKSFAGFCFQENFVTVNPDSDSVYLGGVLVADQVSYLFSLSSSGEMRFPPQLVSSNGRLSAATLAFAAPTHVLDKGLVGLSAYGGKVYGINDVTGQVQWVKAPTVQNLYATVAYDNVDGELYVGSFDGSLYALDVSGWYTWWSYQTNGRIISSPAVIWRGSEKRIVFGSEDGNLYALDKNGRLAWKFFAGSAIYSSVAVSGGGLGGQPYLYFATARGDFYVLDIDGNPVTDPNNPAALGNWLTWSSPAIADHRIFIATAGSPSRFFVLGDHDLTPKVILTSGNLRSVDVGTFGDMNESDHLPGVSLWSGTFYWGEPTLVDGRSTRKAVYNPSRFLMNLANGSSDLTSAFTLKLTYKADTPSYVYQYDGGQYHLLGSLPGDGTWQVGTVATNPSWYYDQRGGSNGVNVLFNIVTTGSSQFYLDKIEMIR